MINEARTYLLNTSGLSRPPLGWYGEEYINPAYIPVTDGGPLLMMRSCLFGGDPDPLTQNFLASRYMAILASGEFGPAYLAQFDPRITYRFDSLMSLSYSPIISADQMNGTKLQFTKPFSGDPIAGNSYDLVTVVVTVSGSEIITVAILPFLLPEMLDSTTFSGSNYASALASGSYGAVVTEQVQITHTASGFYTSDFPVGGGARVMLVNDTGNGPTNSTYVIELMCRPTKTVKDTLNQITVSNTMPALCQEGAVEPYKTFLNMFRQGICDRDRMTGALLATVYATQEERI